jgi:hypothetical protein
MIDPRTKPEIRRELRALHERSTVFWEAFSTAEFLAPIGEAWSPADNVRHLIKSIRPLAGGLRVPRLLVLLRFGPALRGSRGYAEIREVYHGALAKGADAGRFAPSPEGPPADPEAWRGEVMRRWREGADSLDEAIALWSEGSLDRCRMPHPLLGKLTVREMLLFTLYHNLHHVQNVARRKGIVFEERT